jgi:hypothetical protein
MMPTQSAERFASRRHAKPKKSQAASVVVACLEQAASSLVACDSNCFARLGPANRSAL